MHCNIMTSDPAELSNKKCTCVNNRCIRSKISGHTLTVDGLNWVHMRRSLKQVDVKQLYYPVLQEVRLSWRSEFGVSCCSSRIENQVPAEAGPSGPPVEQPHRMRKKSCYSQKSWGSICCSFCPVSNSPLRHNPFVPFWIKCEKYIFLKNCVSLVIIALIMFLHYRSPIE